MNLHAHVKTQRGRFSLDVELRAAPGVTVLAGPSGAGKTSVLRAIAGLLPQTGFVRVGDREWTTLPPESREVGFVFQQHALFPHLTVLDNVAFGAPSREVAQTWLARLKLTDFGARFPSSLSGGEAQRVALARALARQPRVLRLDEPFASLDEALRDELLHEVKSLVDEAKLIALLVTHDRHEAGFFGGPVLRLAAGRVTAT